MKNMKNNRYMYLYICISESLCCTQETNTTLRINSTSVKKKNAGTSLAVQWLGLCAVTAEGLGSIPGQRTKIPHAPSCTYPPLTFLLWQVYLTQVVKIASVLKMNGS